MAGQERIISVDAAGRVESVETADVRETRERLRQLAWLLDSSIPIPGTSLTVGIDALIGLVPLIGDLIGVALSSFILAEASRLGAPRVVLWRMAMNVGIEGIVGIVPFAGDVFDAAFKANQRNVRLLDQWIEHPGKTERSTRLFGLALIGGIVAFLLALGVLAFLIGSWIWTSTR